MGTGLNKTIVREFAVCEVGGVLGAVDGDIIGCLLGASRDSFVQITVVVWGEAKELTKDMGGCLCDLGGGYVACLNRGVRSEV